MLIKFKKGKLFQNYNLLIVPKITMRFLTIYITSNYYLI